MRIRIVVAAVVLLAGTTTSFFGGRYDPPHDEEALVAELARRSDVTQSMLRDVRLPVINGGSSGGSGKRARNAGGPPSSRGLDHVDVVVTVTSLRVGGREVASLPIDPLQTSGSTILPLAQAVAFEREVVVAAGGSPSVVHLYVDEGTPYETFRAVAASFDVPVRLAARARESGTVVFVSWNVYAPAIQMSEFAIDARLANGLLVLANPTGFSPGCYRIPPIDGHVDLPTAASCVAPTDCGASIIRVSGGVDFGDFVKLVAILDAVSDEAAPYWDLCRHSDCIARAEARQPRRIPVTDLVP